MHTTFHRGRRLRQIRQMRELVRETPPLLAEELIMPYFVVETANKNFRKEIPSMPGQFQLGIDALAKQVETVPNLKAVLLFGLPAQKDDLASGAYAENGIVQQAVARLKSIRPELLVITDVCLCEYMSHGHCGILSADGTVQNDATLPLLAQTALSHIRAGADIVAPSDMMDGRIAAIRNALDAAGFTYTPVFSYAVKYASAFYGPFREAADSAPASGDRKSYQMDSGNSREAVVEARADIAEGADALIVKPAGPYGDIIYKVRQAVDVPICAYQVSGEYAMLRAAGINGWIDEKMTMLESLQGIKRAGADMVITYFTQDLLQQKLVR